ncbi:hypothetical protein ONZ45_g3838 [Pleurotus djamor]|nr:hypothetical protein ONZ45_g3838 [Pleurotus djamor]
MKIEPSDDSPTPTPSVATTRRSLRKGVKREIDEISNDDPSDKLGPPTNKAKKEKKEKKNDNALTLYSVTSRLKAISEEIFPVTLDPSIRDVAVSRNFMKDHYGGSTQSTYPTIGEAFLAKHGMNDFMYPKLEFNPHAPQSPGAPGLLYRPLPAPAYEWEKIQRLFIGLAANQWLYVGQFKLTPAPDLSKEEWLAQDGQFRKKWIDVIAKKGRGVPMRAKLTLKKRLGREPTKEEQEAAIASAPKGRIKFPISIDEIQEAYDSGEERIPIWCMQCIEYDEAFQRDLAEKFKKWKNPGKKTTTKRRAHSASEVDED